MRVLHIITGLGDGGAEAVLFRLCTHDVSSEHIVISLTGPGKYGPELEKSGVKFYALGMRTGTPSFRWVRKIYKIVRLHKPDIIQGWMYHGNLVASLTRSVAGGHRVVWGIHHSNLDRTTTSLRTLLVARILALTSRWLPQAIIYCAQSAQRSHESFGFDHRNGVVVPNGYDISLFKMSPEERQTIRGELCIDDTTPLIGIVARWHPDKDHRTLIQAFQILIRSVPSARILFIGPGMVEDNISLSYLLAEYEVEDQSYLLGRRDDVPALMNAMDLHVLSSSSEAFPNVLAEAMACGIPCISTDVGDAREIIGDTGWVTPRRDPVALGRALIEALNSLNSQGFQDRGPLARERIVSKFKISTMVDGYHDVWESNVD